MARPKLDTAIRQEQIAEAALQIVQTHGLSGLSMERIGLSIGVVPSALYRHYRDKDSVLDAVLELMHNRLLELVDSACSERDAALDRLQLLLRRHVTLIQQFQAVPRILFSDQVYSGNPARKARLHELMKDYLGRVATVVEQGQRDGSIQRDLDSGSIAVMFLGLFQPTVMLWFMSEGGFDVMKHIDRAWKIFVSAIATESGVASHVPRRLPV